MDNETREQRHDHERQQYDELRSAYIVRAYLLAHPERPLARQVAAGQQSIESAAEIMNEFVRDPKTGVLRTDYLPYAIEFENVQSRELALPYSIGLFDLDNFKELNTELGYDVVDGVLELVASTIVQTIRQSDEVANASEGSSEDNKKSSSRSPLGDSTIRYGGEEFVVIFSGTTQATSHVAAERVRHAIQTSEEIQNYLHSHGSQRTEITVSCGLAEHRPEVEEDWSKLITSANEQLTAAKTNGKNAVYPIPKIPV